MGPSGTDNERRAVVMSACMCFRMYVCVQRTGIGMLEKY